MKILYFSTITLTLLLAFSCKSAKTDLTKNTDTEFNTLKLKIEKGLIEDQRIRKAYYKKLEIGVVDMALNTEMGRVDSANQVIVLEFLEKYGWPKKSEVGDKVSRGVFLIIQHADYEVMKRYLPHLMAMVEIGEASKKHGALMTDRVLMDEGKRQIYGTQSVPRRNKEGYLTQEYYIWPIQNPKLVNSLRAEIGFESTIEAYAKAINASYDPDEVLPNLRK